MISDTNRLAIEIAFANFTLDIWKNIGGDRRLANSLYYLAGIMRQRLNSIIAHGGLRRGEADLDRFFDDMIERLNDPKNVAKGDYLALSWIEIKNKLKEEVAEVDGEMMALSLGHGDPAAAIREFADVAVVAMIGAAKVAKATQD